MISSISFAIVTLCVIGYVQSHSWIACSDYTEKNGGNWDPNRCRGFPRDSRNYAPKNSFGLDRGFDHKPGNGGDVCKTRYSASSYSSEYPKAIYYPGQQVVIVHPMKNHGADRCTNAHIPDFGNAIYRGVNAMDRSGTLAHFKANLVSDLGRSPVGQPSLMSIYPKPGYQNAPNFCDDTDKSMGTYSFNIPGNIAPGEYTFVWRWSFNGPQDHYSTCFEVIIAPNKASRDQQLQSRGVSDLSVACGGTVSNNGAGSTVGCTPGATAPPGPSTVAPTTTRSTTTTTPRTTTRRTTTPPQTPGFGQRRVPMKAYQLSGEISLGPAVSTVTRRFVSVHFDCSVEASFWNARLLRSHNHENSRKKRHSAIHYDLVQEQSGHVASGKIYFTATYSEACDIISNPPIATITMEE
nr:uncharacterized protein LOC100175308 [Ciona intestinalis]|eukprot:XP_002127986.1 uncharacterized protein LOC100175308 [Ciona intestinalis]